MKLKILLLLLVVMILIIQIPALAWEEVPVETLPNPPFDETVDYWVMYHGRDNNIYLVWAHSPVTVETNEEYLIIEGGNPNIANIIYKLVDNQWIEDRRNTSGWRFGFYKVYKANHDLAYVDGSGFFFRAELPEPDDGNNGFWEDLEDFFSWFDPDSWLGDIVSSVQESVGLLTEPIERIINFLNPLHEDFFLRVAFIPSQGYVEEFRTEIKAIFDNKFSFISEIRDFLAFIFSSPNIDNTGPPEFKITLPGGKWGSGSVQIIDFSIFEDCRLFIINFIRVLLWIPFLIKLYKRLPSIVY